ncbi:porin family protein [Danxiaibacter flavus]|uniref:Porin family protein n=1 Tax=Danxiaibacter flavus TaxID=3049108 RepID=A0ABV3ZIS2_9BACT|nr:porin family protein [Chitinophagaceae bacterium DXS]
MKNRLILLLAVSAITAGSAQAQTTTTTSTHDANPGGIYIKGGYNLANISKYNDGSVDAAKGLSTFHAGGVVDIPIAPVLSLQPGLLLTGKGAKANYYVDPNNHSDNYVKSSFNPLYLELPVNLLLKFPIGNDARIFAGAGPYAAMGIGGKSKTEVSTGGVVTSTSHDIKFNNDNPLTPEEEGARYDRLKKFDFGINALAGVEFNRFLVGVNYGWGLEKINSTQTNNTQNGNNKYRTLSVSLGVRLN